MPYDNLYSYLDVADKYKIIVSKTIYDKFSFDFSRFYNRHKQENDNMTIEGDTNFIVKDNLSFMIKKEIPFHLELLLDNKIILKGNVINFINIPLYNDKPVKTNKSETINNEKNYYKEDANYSPNTIEKLIIDYHFSNLKVVIFLFVIFALFFAIVGGVMIAEQTYAPMLIFLIFLIPLALILLNSVIKYNKTKKDIISNPNYIMLDSKYGATVLNDQLANHLIGRDSKFAATEKYIISIYTKIFVVELERVIYLSSEMIPSGKTRIPGIRVLTEDGKYQVVYTSDYNVTEEVVCKIADDLGIIHNFRDKKIKTNITGTEVLDKEFIDNCIKHKKNSALSKFAKTIKQINKDI